MALNPTYALGLLVIVALLAWIVIGRQSFTSASASGSTKRQTAPATPATPAITAADLQRLEQDERRFVVMFHKDGCGPCAWTTPVFEEAAAARKKKSIPWVRMEEKQIGRQTFDKYHVTGFPTIVLVSDKGKTSRHLPKTKKKMLAEADE